VRRGAAAGALVVILVLVVLGVHSCQVSQANSALRNYSDSVASVIRSSNSNGARFFSLLASGAGSSNAPSLQSQIDETRLTAQAQLQRAQGFSAPDQLKTAQQQLIWALQFRLDGISNIAQQLPPALQAPTSTAAVNSIATETARFYASDVLYKDYALPGIVSALHSAGIAVGGSSGEPIDGDQFLPSLQWLTPSYIALELHAPVPASTTSTTTTKAAPGVHGHALDSCSIGATTLDSASTTTIPSGSTPTLSCTVTNDGQNSETNVIVKATVGGTSVIGQGVIPQTQPGQQYTVQIPLSSSPPAGTYSLTVAVQHVPGETTFTHNDKTFQVTFP
jgi:CARDB protein